MRAALKSYARAVEKESSRLWRRQAHKAAAPTPYSVSGRFVIRRVAARTALTPYVFHVSEDIYTSIVLHSDEGHRYRSVLHPEVESKMLSPQDLLSWTVQHFKYAGGTLDIALHDNPVWRHTMPWSCRLMYAATIWSYLTVAPNLVFLAAPIVYSFTGIAPVKSYSWAFALVVVPFLLLTQLAMMVGTWGIATVRERGMRLAMFPVVLRALWAVLRHQPIRFAVTPKERLEAVFPELVVPQLAVILLTVAGWVYSLTLFATGRWPLYEEAGLVVNGFWGLYNVVSLGRIVAAAYYQPPRTLEEPTSRPRSEGWMAARGHLLIVLGLLIVTGVLMALDRGRP